MLECTEAQVIVRLELFKGTINAGNPNPTFVPAAGNGNNESEGFELAPTAGPVLSQPFYPSEIVDWR